MTCVQKYFPQQKALARNAPVRHTNVVSSYNKSKVFNMLLFVLFVWFGLVGWFGWYALLGLLGLVGLVLLVSDRFWFRMGFA